MKLTDKLLREIATYAEMPKAISFAPEVGVRLARELLAARKVVEAGRNVIQETCYIADDQRRGVFWCCGCYADLHGPDDNLEGHTEDCEYGGLQRSLAAYDSAAAEGI